MAYEKLSSIMPGSLLADAAYDQLSEGILLNQLPPGTSLSVPELSRRLGISRSPVREAVQRLIHDGLADYRGRRGTVVSSIEIAAFVELLEVRSVLEGLASGLAAERGSRDEMAQLEKQHEQFLKLRSDAETSESAFVQLDMRFHQLIREMARNEELGMLLARTQARAHLSMHSLWSGARNVQEAQREHSGICAAILSGDPADADRASRHHIESLRDRALDIAESESIPGGEDEAAPSP
jgi:DNA-binding GntR family transcriptional regulator